MTAGTGSMRLCGTARTTSTDQKTGKCRDSPYPHPVLGVGWIMRLCFTLFLACSFAQCPNVSLRVYNLQLELDPSDSLGTPVLNGAHKSPDAVYGTENLRLISITLYIPCRVF